MDGLYFDWLCSLVYTRKYSARKYSSLMHFLHEKQFVYIVDMDETRVADGIALRYKFTLSEGYSESAASDIDDHDWCSMLEMLVALSLRCEEDIIGDPTDIKVHKWFWIMLENCGLAALTNDIFSYEKADSITDGVLYRDYRSDGFGGLFYIPDTKVDLRQVDVWYQLNWYLNYITRGEK